MKRLLLAVVGTLAVAVTSASAADMPPSRSLPPPLAPAYVPFFTCNGFYVGINAGYGFGHSQWTDSLTLDSTGEFTIKGSWSAARPATICNSAPSFLALRAI